MSLVFVWRKLVKLLLVLVRVACLGQGVAQPAEMNGPRYPWKGAREQPYSVVGVLD